MSYRAISYALEVLDGKISSHENALRYYENTIAEVSDELHLLRQHAAELCRMLDGAVE